MDTMTEVTDEKKKWGWVQLSVRQIPSTFLFLCYTPALQHSLQDLRWCKLFHIHSAPSEETLRGILSNKMSLHSSWISSVLHFFFFSNFMYYLFRYWLMLVLLSQCSTVIRSCPSLWSWSYIECGRDMELREVEKGPEYSKMHRELDWTICSLICGRMQLNCDCGAIPTTTGTAESWSSSDVFNPITNIRCIWGTHWKLIGHYFPGALLHFTSYFQTNIQSSYLWYPSIFV